MTGRGLPGSIPGPHAQLSARGDIGPVILSVGMSEPWRRGVATLLMDAAEQRAADRGITTLGITVGLFDEYGPAQRMYARRGYVPDGRGACQGQRPLSEGTQVRLDHDVIIWLTKELTS